MIRRLAGFLVIRNARAPHYVEAVGAAIIAYASALVGVQLAELLAEERWVVVVVHASVVIVLLASIAVLAAQLGGAISALTERRQNLLRHAEYEADRVVTSAHEHLAEVRREPSMPTLWVPHDAEAGIRAEVFGLYRTLQDSEGPVPPGMRVNFEVTFMTRSPEDGKITIAAWANRQNRAPVSLTMRAENPDIYDQSATADMYRESTQHRPLPRLIESTVGAGNGYRTLYAGQTDDIRSMIVYPVFNLDTELVGTLVLYCDQEGYFKQSDYAFWCELLEPVAARIALEQERLQATATSRNVSAPSSAMVFRPSPAPRHR